MKIKELFKLLILGVVIFLIEVGYLVYFSEAFAHSFNYPIALYFIPIILGIFIASVFFLVLYYRMNSIIKYHYLIIYSIAISLTPTLYINMVIIFD